MRAIVLFAFLAVQVSAASLGEVIVCLEMTFWSQRGDGGTKSRTNSARCVFGTDRWFIEADNARNSRESWWCTESNLVRRLLITSRIPRDGDETLSR